MHDPPLQTEHPPHRGGNYHQGHGFRRFLIKLILLVPIFVLSFHIQGYAPSPHPREKIIREIRAFLEKKLTGPRIEGDKDLAEVIYEEALRYNYDPKFLLALIDIESSFCVKAVSERGAKGLMQIMPVTGELIAEKLGIAWKGDHTLFTPHHNIRIGTYYLSQLLNDFKDLAIALAAYNLGPTYVRSLLERRERIPLDYYRKIISVYQSL